MPHQQGRRDFRLVSREWLHARLLPVEVDAVSSSSAPGLREDHLVALQGVQQKLGQCLIRLQQYEMVMKDFVARARVEGPADSIAVTQAARAAGVAQQTLGQVVGAFVGTVFDEPVWAADGFPVAADGGVWVGSGFSMTLSDETLGGVKAGMADLVALRNELVHGFVLQHDLQSEAGCLAAATALDDTHRVIDGHFQELLGSYKGMLDLARATAELLTLPEFQGNFFPDIIPDQVGVDWSASTIEQLLRGAEGELSRSGWTLLDDAVAFIRRVAPEHTPGRYGCSTWRQVLHESNRTFAVRREAGGPGTPGRTWYRSRQTQSVQGPPDSRVDPACGWITHRPRA